MPRNERNRHGASSLRSATVPTIGPAGAPDLIAVSGIDPDGELVDGYAWREQLFAFSPDSGPGPSDPKEAQEMQTDRDSTYPDGWDIAVYDSDGTTQIGTFRVG